MSDNLLSHEDQRTNEVFLNRVTHVTGEVSACRWAAQGLPTLTDKGYTGAGIGIIFPTKGHYLAPDNQTRNPLISALRAPAERANALLKRTWQALERVTLDPWRIGAITAAALVPLHLQRPTR